MPLIAIDGPAGAGKSTVSARWPGGSASSAWTPGPCTGPWPGPPWTGGSTRATARRWPRLAGSLDIAVGERVTVDGTDVTRAIRSPEVSRAVSAVAATPGSGASWWSANAGGPKVAGGGVVEGRDIGTVVFPDADLKVFLTASPEERARRRHDEAPEGVARRDRLDSSRATSPLVQAADARRLDTTGRSVEDVVEEVLSWL